MAVSLTSTSLYRLLEQRSPGMTYNMKDLCEEAANRVKGFYQLHPQFTLHDEVHFCRVVDLMGRVMGSSCDRLNEAELAILILAAYWHDQGMVPEADELPKLRQTPEFTLFRENWELDHPNIAELRLALKQAHLSVERQREVANRLGEMEQALLSDYLRLTHAQRSATMVLNQLEPDPRARVRGSSLAPCVALLCKSHTMNPQNLENTALFERARAIAPDVTVNEPYLATVLRLADILDLDRERTPDALRRALGPTSPVSIAEWEKHRSVAGWQIGEGRTVFRFECLHPEYERTARRFMDWVDDELSAAHALLAAHPNWFTGLQLDVPVRVDRSQIGPKMLADGRAPYLYTDLEFRLSRDEIVHLVLADELYRDKAICVRELLQNALDALRHRSAQHAVADEVLRGLKVRFEQDVNADGVEVIRCIDNGVGMTQDIIERFLTRVGRSYYRSPEFERERIGFKAANCDFDPCARFGIGFMSCFMLGDQITLRTRRDLGPGRGYGPPLTVEIHGLSGMLVIRPGDSNQPVGTTVEIALRRQAIDEFNNRRVDVVDTVRKWALACEFPVEAVNRVPEEEAQEILPAFEVAALPEGISEDKCTRTFRVDVHEVDPNLRGTLQLTMLANKDGRPTLKNSFAQFYGGMTQDGFWWRYQRDGEDMSVKACARLEPERSKEGISLCSDGILLTNSNKVPTPPDEQGQSRESDLMVHYVTGVIDFRGPLKPTLTPSREPTFSDGYDRPPLDATWYRCAKLALRCIGTLWGRILQAAGDDNEAHNAFLAMLDAEGSSLSVLPLGLLWNHLRLPIDRGQTIEWIPLREIKELRVREQRLSRFGEASIGGQDVHTFAISNTHGPTSRSPYGLNLVALALGEVSADEHGLVAKLSPPTDAARNAEMYRFGHWFAGRPAGAPPDVFADTKVLGLMGGVLNREHELVRLGAAAWVDPKPDALLQFAKVMCDELSAWPSLRLERMRAAPKQPSEAAPDSRILQRLGRLYDRVAWDEAPASARPPYKIRSGESDSWLLTHEQFQEWARLPRTKQAIDDAD